jgi:hypothetical protein
MGRGTHRCERIEEGLEDAGLAQPVEALPYAVPGAEAFRQSAPTNVLDGEEMQRFEEAAIVLSFPPASRQAGANTLSVGAQSSSSIFVDIGPARLIRSESYESCLIQKRNPKNINCRKFVHSA